MMAKPTSAAPLRAPSTMLSGWRMCQAMRVASHAGRRPVSTSCRAMSASDGACAARAGASTEVSPALTSGERVEHVLDVVVLLEAVDHGEHVVSLVLGQLGRYGGDVLVLGRQGCEGALLECLLQPTKISERAADHQLRLALLAG